VGIACDVLGYEVAIGHVLTGLSGGQHRNRQADLRPWFGRMAGHTLDNLYAATLAGDIGQSAVEIHYHPNGPLIGAGSELSFAEAIGDIDGLLMGDEGGLMGRTVSRRLLDYYCVLPNEPNGMNAANRFAHFAPFVDEHLLTESRHFAVNFLYRRNRGDGLMDSTEAEVNRVHEAFVWWLRQRKSEEAQRRETADREDQERRVR
jgi:hypothetical protein